VAKLNPSLSTIEWATFYGDLIGSRNSITMAGPIQLDGSGNVYIQGSTQTGGLTTVNPVEPNAGGYQETFVAEFDPTGSKLLFSTFVGNGGTGDNASYAPAGLAVDTDGNIYLAGNTTDPGLIVTPGAFMTTESDFNGQCCAYGNGFVAKISALGTATAALVVSPSPAQAGQTVTMTVTVTKTATYASVPTGTVAFDNGTSVLSTVALDSSGVATYTTSSLNPNTYTLTAIYSGDSTYPTGNATASLTVTGLNATVKVTPAASSVTTASSLSVTVAVSGSSATPTGTVTLTGGGFNSTAATLSGGSATIVIPANSLSVGSDTLTASYSGDTTYSPATGTASETVNALLTPSVKVTPAATTIVVSSSLSVTVALTGSGATPTGTITLSGGGYTSTATSLSGGSATIVIPANSLSVGSDILTASYSGDTNYASARGTASVTVAALPLTPTVTVTPSATTLDSGSTLSVPVAVTGAGVTPTGTVTLSGGGYTSTTGTLANGSYTFAVPANSLSAGSDTLTVSYSGDANYATGTGTASVSVTESVYTVAASTPPAVSPGSPATLTVTVSTPSGYSGTITLVCALTSSPSGAQDLPTCTGSTVTLGGGTTTGTATITVSSTAATRAMARPDANGFGRGWAGGGAALAFLVFLGIPARRRKWLSMLGVLALMVVLASLSACGGKSSSSGNSGTTAGNYTFTVTGAGSPSVTPAPTTTFTLTIN
jgi:hypothetical protein